jgi:predicted nucleotide-binding protein (sugar kinase/HSP70/actin superfamily)
MMGSDAPRTEYRLSFPHMGNYHVPMVTLAKMLDSEIVVPPKMTRRTLELGARYSPEFVCIPFKYNLGNYIEALDAGANLLIQAAGGCRFGYYSEVQAAILRDMGYEFEMLRLLGGFDLREYHRKLRSINPTLTFRRALRHYRLAAAQTAVLDAVEDLMRKRSGFEVDEGSFDAVFDRFLRKLADTGSIDEARALEERTLAEMESLPIERPDDMLRVGVVGELYVLMEPFSNLFVERELAKRGVEVHRFITVTDMLSHAGRKHAPHIDEMIELSGPYLKYHVGAHGTESVGLTNKLMNEGFDGVLHLKPFGCMPEVNAMAALQRLSREHTFPVLFLSYDSQTSETGVRTRLEAFCDMLRMSRKARRAAMDAEDALVPPAPSPPLDRLAPESASPEEVRA